MYDNETKITPDQFMNIINQIQMFASQEQLQLIYQAIQSRIRILEQQKRFLINTNNI